MVAPVEKFPLLDRKYMQKQITAAHSMAAVKPEGASQSIQVAKLVLGVLKSIDQDERSEQEDQPWFVLGRDLAVQLLEIITSLEIEQDCAAD